MTSVETPVQIKNNFTQMVPINPPFTNFTNDSVGAKKLVEW